MKKIFKNLASTFLAVVLTLVVFGTPVLASETSVVEVSTTEVSSTVITPTFRTLSVNPIGAYQCVSFYGKSAPEPVCLTEDCDSISITAACLNDGDEDVVTCYIKNLITGEFFCSFDVEADGSTTTIPYSFPADTYKVFATGNSSIEKEITVRFDKVN